MLSKDKAYDLTGMDRWFRYHMPYCLVPLKSKNTWLPVNRNYKPLGQMNSEFVDYEKFETVAIKFKNNPREINGVWSDATENFLYLYDDDPVSRKDYFARLEKLLSAAATVPNWPGSARD